VSEKLDGLVARLSQERGDDTLIHIVKRGVELTTPPYYIPDTDPVQYVLPEDALPLAEEVLRLRRVKDFLGDLASAVKEYTSEVEIKLFEVMAEKGPTGFTHMGQTFAMSSNKQIQAIKELGGTGNPDLKQWLIDNGAPKVAEGTINANTLKSTISTWLKDHPIEATKQVGDDQVPLSGQELLDALGLSDRVELREDDEGNEISVTVTAAEQLADRIARHETLLTMVKVHSEPTLSVTKKK
jgi:hypothetical protein